MKTKPKKEENIRKLSKTAGGTSYAVTLPIDIIRKWGWRERQKLELVIDEKNQIIKIKDWKKK